MITIETFESGAGFGFNLVKAGAVVHEQPFNPENGTNPYALESEAVTAAEALRAQYE